MSDIKTSNGTALEYGFRWFEFHAKQRITTFNLYLVVYSGLAGAESFLLKEEIHTGSMMISLIMILMSVVFWQLDVRNRQLIGIGEFIVSQSWSKNGFDEGLNPISHAAIKQPGGLRFRQLFEAVFSLGSVVGVAAFGYSLYLLPV